MQTSTSEDHLMSNWSNIFVDTEALQQYSAESHESTHRTSRKLERLHNHNLNLTAASNHLSASHSLLEIRELSLQALAQRRREQHCRMQSPPFHC